MVSAGFTSPEASLLLSPHLLGIRHSRWFLCPISAVSRGKRPVVNLASEGKEKLLDCRAELALVLDSRRARPFVEGLRGREFRNIDYL